ATTLYQYSTITALLHGICTDGLEASSLSSYGTHGIGTLSDLDGEIIILDGEVYHFPSTPSNNTGDTPTPSVRTPEPTERIPFAMLTTFQPTHTLPLPSTPLTSTTLSNHIFAQALSDQRNTPLAIRLTTGFSSLSIRIIPKRTSREETLSACASRQKTTELGSMNGTLFGFWTPKYMAGLGVAGWHLHFLSEDRKAGGHVLEF
ncbi:acetolactate decarboxylase, partial [Aspergillus saccharolyticus JOP 1030-1]